MILDLDFELYEHQENFLFSEKLHTALIGGYGSGKSHAGVVKTVLEKLKLGSEIPVAYYLPTYGLIRDVAYPKFKEVFIQNKIPFTLNKSDHDFTTPYGKFHLRSMNNPDNIVGYETGYGLIDETDILPLKKMEEVFEKIIARNRLRLPEGILNRTDVVGTPEGYKWAYKMFEKEKRDERLLIRGSTYDNTTLSDTYIQTLKNIYTEEQLKAYLNGYFINMTSGSVYKYFNRHVLNTNRIVMPNDILHIGLDFNVTNMNATVSVREGNHNFTVDEFAKVYDTFEMIDKINEKYGSHKINIYPDASGKSRKTSAKKSDHQLLKDAGFNVKSKLTNPLVKDRVNCVNSNFMQGKSYVNVDKCPVLTEALENIAYKDGEPDKTSGYDHITEAYGYQVYYNETVKLITGKSTY